MPDFIRKRFQVFVSSTYSDLKVERQAAVEAILTAGHIPAGMELFTSGDESQMVVIKQWIDESDVYMLILGGRYGSVEPKTQKSYTQLEYEYAVSLNKPVFSCVIHNYALDNKVKAYGSSVIERDNPKALEGFKRIVLSRMIRYWEDHKDIKIAIGETLAEFSRRDDVIGWVRSHREANTVVLADEIARLSKENSALRQKLRNRSKESHEISGLSFDEMARLLEHQDIYDFLVENRTKLATVYKDEQDLYTEKLLQLCTLGLIRSIEFQEYSLTREGQIFLAKVGLDLLESERDKA